MLRVWDVDSLGFRARCCLGDFRGCLGFLGLGLFRVEGGLLQGSEFGLIECSWFGVGLK